MISPKQSVSIHHLLKYQTKKKIIQQKPKMSSSPLPFPTIIFSILFFIITIICTTTTFASVEPDLRPTQTIKSLSVIAVTQNPALPLMRTTSDGNPFQPPFQNTDPDYAQQWHSISNTFQPRWKISANAYDMHRGLDIWNESIGVPITNIGTGTLSQVTDSTSSSGGRTVRIEHDLPASISSGSTKFHGRDINKVFSIYNHLDAIDAAILSASIGSSVTKGQVIGTMGQTGTTTFAHLHFETRLVGYCSKQYQVENGGSVSPTSKCFTGFDPHVHPFLFIEAENSGSKTIDEIAPLNSSYIFGIRYNTTRGHLDFDRIVSDFGTVGLNLREGMNASTIEQLDDLPRINHYMSLIPGVFQSSSSVFYLDFHFRQGYQPSFIEIYDIYGNGIKMNEAITTTTTNDAASSSATTFSTAVSTETTVSASPSPDGGGAAKNDEGGEDVNVAAVAGGSIGGVLVVVGACVLIYFFVIKKKKNSDDGTHNNNQQLRSPDHQNSEEMQGRSRLQLPTTVNTTSPHDLL